MTTCQQCKIKQPYYKFIYRKNICRSCTDINTINLKTANDLLKTTNGTKRSVKIIQTHQTRYKTRKKIDREIYLNNDTWFQQDYKVWLFNCNWDWLKHSIDREFDIHRYNYADIF